MSDTSAPRRLRVLHICDHLGWPGSRMHGVKRLFAWMLPRFDASRYHVSLISLRKKDLSEDTLEQLGIDVRYLSRGKFDPATLTDLLKLIDREQADVLQQVLPEGTGASPVLIQFGSPGPFQKVVVLSVSPAGRAWVSKIGFRPGADDLLAGEASWLARLGQIADIKTYVPELALAGRLASGRCFLTMPAATVQPSRAQLGPLHRRFLQHLCRASVSEWLWDEAPLRRRLHDRFLRLSGSVASPVLNGPLEEWQRIDAELRGQVIPTCIGHGDFAPWNINRDARAITVFDWEYAQDSATPLHDFFHFHCIQRVLLRRSRLRPRGLDALLQAGRSHLQAVLPSVDQSANRVAQMFGLYLLDTLSMYVEASGGVDAGDLVVADCVECLLTLRLLDDPPAERVAGSWADRTRWSVSGTGNGDATVSIRPR